MKCVVCEKSQTANEYEWACRECHERIHRCLGTTKDGNPCKIYHKNYTGYCGKHRKGHEFDTTYKAEYERIRAYREERERQTLEWGRGFIEGYMQAQAIALPADNWLRALVEQE